MRRPDNGLVARSTYSATYSTIYPTIYPTKPLRRWRHGGLGVLLGLLTLVMAGVTIALTDGTTVAAQTTSTTAQQVGEPPAPGAATKPTPSADPGQLVPGAIPNGTAGGQGDELIVPAPVAPVAPTPPAGAPTANQPSLELTLPTGDGGVTSQPLTIVLLLTIIGLAPSMLLLMTSFTRIAIVLGLTRNALSLQGTPPNQVLIGLSLFLTLFIMGPVLTQANDTALQPYLKGEITQQEAYTKGIEPFRDFMLTQVRDSDLELFASLAGGERPASPEDVPTSTLIPAFVIGELRAAFLLGFVIFIPFLVIDIVVSSTLMSMGMVMLPPVAISLPFKLLLFVVVDGWQLTVGTLVQSFKT